MFYVYQYYTWKFILINASVDTTKTWNLPLLRSDRNEYDENSYPTYAVTEIGVDSTGFYYIEEYSEYDAVGNPITQNSYKRYISLISGEFMLTFIPRNKGAPLHNPYEIDDAYQSMFSIYDVSIVSEIEHITCSIAFGNDSDFPPITVQGRYGLGIIIETETGYSFTDDDVDIVYGGLGNSPYDDFEIHDKILSADNKKIVIFTPSFMGYSYYNLGCVNAIIKGLNVHKDAFDVTESLIGVSVTGSATVNYLATYTGLVNLLTGYSYDGISVNVYMGGVLVENAYDEDTHIITVNSVDADIEIIITAIKEHTFRFFSSDGLTLFATYSGVSIESLLLTISGTQRTLTINGTNVYTWNVAIPENKSLTGFAEIQNSDRYLIPLGILYETPLIEDTDLYESMDTASAIPSTFTLNLYKNTAESNRVFKDSYLTSVGTLTGTLRASCDLLNPVVRVEYEYINFNYVYIPQFNRFYYLMNAVNVSKNIWDVQLKVDVLMSFKTEILKQTGYIERNEFKDNPLIVDNQMVYENKPEIKITELPISQFDVEQSGTGIFSGIDKALRFVITVVDSKGD